MELHVVINEQAHPLDHVRRLRDLALVFQQVSHDRLHDFEQQVALRLDVVVETAHLDADA